MNLFKRWRKKKEEEEGRDAEDTVEMPLPGPDVPSVTGTYETLKHQIDEATEEKRKARSSIQRVLGMLPRGKDKK